VGSKKEIASEAAKAFLGFNRVLRYKRHRGLKIKIEKWGKKT